MTRRYAFASCALMGFLVTVACSGPGPGGEHPDISEVEEVPLRSVSPEFALPSFDPGKERYEGEMVSLYQDLLADGKPVVMNFWATWCGPCIVELPHFEELAERRPDLLFTTVAVSDTTDYLGRFIERSGLSLPVLLDPRGFVSGKLDSDMLPTTLVFGTDGSLLLRTLASFHSAEHLEEALDVALEGVEGG